MKLLLYYSGDDLKNAVCELPILTDDHAFRDYLDRKQHGRRHASKLTSPKPARKRGTKARRRAKSTPEMQWLKDLICPFVYGDKTPDGPMPSVKKDAFIGRWNLRLPQYSLPNYKMLDHFQGRETLYFMGRGGEKAERTLVMIDIDVMKALNLGTPNGARKFAEHLRTIWPDLYFEPSTNGKGIHGYFILWKRGSDAKTTNAALKRLEAWLRAEAKKINADIEQVEIKGTCLDMTFDGRLLQAVKYGVLAKLPRDVRRFAEWQQTTMLRVQDLERSQFDVRDEPVVKQETVLAKDESPTVIQLPVANASGSARKERKPVSGSVSGKFINDNELEAIPAFERLYREWVGPQDLMAGKFRVTAHDFAVAMVLLRHFKAQPNNDRSLPCRRVQELWNGLKEAGDIDRAWNHHRWKVIRDFLSARGHIDWTDHRYEQPGMVKDHDGVWSRSKDKNGKSSRGIACKWAITDQFAYWLERVSLMAASKQGEASLVDTSFRKLVPAQGTGKNLRPVGCQLLKLRFLMRAEQACDLLCAA
jgi:hypothetical protein